MNGRESRNMHDEGNYYNSVLSENLRDISVQEKYIKDYLSEMELDPSVLERVLEHNKKYNILAQQNEEVSRNVIWKIKNAEWDNLFNYGEKNKINFEELRGLVGIFGRNYSGKSSIIDSILFTIFNATSKGERKNVHVINQNQKKANGKVQIEIGDKTYQICRNLEKYTKRSRGKETEEARVDLDFSLISDNESLNGTTRNETDANIRKKFGTMDDFLLTSMASQLDSLSFVKEGSTKRKEILAKFLDLQIFDKKFKLAKKDAADLRGVVKRLQDKQWDREIQKNVEILKEIEEDLSIQYSKCEKISDESEKVKIELDNIISQIESIPAEPINIDEVISEIENTEKKKNTLTEQRSDLDYQIWDLEKIIKSDIKKYDSIDIAKLDLAKESAAAIELKIKETRQALDVLISQETNEKKKIKILDEHKYDPNCKFCCDNQFVKNAHKAKEDLPETTRKVIHLQQLLRDLYDNLSELKIEHVDKQKTIYTTLENVIQKSKRTLEMHHLAAEGNKSKIDLLHKEYLELCEKRNLYEENREAIENLETLNRERSALEKIIQNKSMSYSKCQDKITNILVEQKQPLRPYRKTKRNLRKWKGNGLHMICFYSVCMQMEYHIK